LAASIAGGTEPVRFSRDILPLLSDNCFRCHGPDEKVRKAKLRLDTETGSEEVIVRGKSGESEIIRRITSTDPDEVMPPPKAKGKLSLKQIELLKRWVDEGAPWGRHWAYEPLQPPPVPEGQQPVDYFVRARLTQDGLALSPAANKETLIRRVTFDLTGLPPTLDEVDAFVQDSSPAAYEQVVDRLLASSRFGERMAWDWLDAARYADSNGYFGDPDRTMWPWRDWVIRAFNANMPFNQFTIEQLAGDLLPNATADQKLATAFNRHNMYNGDAARMAEENRVEPVMDRVETTATVWLASTFTCARCHDHKFDPFTQREYFGIYDMFNQMSETGKDFQTGQIPPMLDLSTPEEKKAYEAAAETHAGLAEEVKAFEAAKFSSPADLLTELANGLQLKKHPKERKADILQQGIKEFKESDPDYVALLQKLLRATRVRDTAKINVTKPMVMDTVAEPRATFVLSKGVFDKPTGEPVLGSLPTSIAPGDAPASNSRLTRLDLARWLVSSDKPNPLTARAVVNRWWEMFFGIGLVKTVEDFGAQGEFPSHPELLDRLAADFICSGWDVKAFCKRIVMSETYRQSSTTSPALNERDPENRLLARGPRHRRPSWMLRDAALAVGGLLVDRLGGKPVRPYQPEGFWEEITLGKIHYVQDHGDPLYRRSLYTFWRRSAGPPIFFDNSARQVCSVKSSRTNTPLHALTTLNDVTFVEAARGLAQRVMLAEKATDLRIQRAFRLLVSRRPKAEESELLATRLEFLRKEFAAAPGEWGKLLAIGESPRDESLEPVEHAAFTTLCLLLLNLDEALTKG